MSYKQGRYEKKESNIELLRVFSMLMIVAFHIYNHCIDVCECEYGDSGCHNCICLHSDFYFVL